MKTASNTRHPVSQVCLKCGNFKLDPLDIPEPPDQNVQRMPRWGTCSVDNLAANVAYWCELFERRQSECAKPSLEAAE